MGLCTSGSKAVLADRLSKHDGRRSDLGSREGPAADDPRPSAAAAAAAAPSRAGGRGRVQGRGSSTAAARPGEGPPRLKQTSKRDNFVRMNMKVTSGCLSNAYPMQSCLCHVARCINQALPTTTCCGRACLHLPAKCTRRAVPCSAGCPPPLLQLVACPCRHA